MFAFTMFCFSGSGQLIYIYQLRRNCREHSHVSGLVYYDERDDLCVMRLDEHLLTGHGCSWLPNCGFYFCMPAAALLARVDLCHALSWLA